VKAQRRMRLLGVLVLALGLTAGFAGDAAAQKKKKKKKVQPFALQMPVNALIPEDPVDGYSVPVVSQITVPKAYRGLKVGDVNVTGLQTSGSTEEAAEHLKAKLTAPNGRTVLLFDTVFIPDPFPSANLGPWTLDDDTFISICMDTDCEDPTEALQAPFAGTTNLLNNDDNNHGPGAGPLSNFDGVNMRGTWTLRIWDEDNTDIITSVFNQWGLEIRPLKLKPPTVQVN
jgi:hypothetical protein